MSRPSIMRSRSMTAVAVAVLLAFAFTPTSAVAQRSCAPLSLYCDAARPSLWLTPASASHVSYRDRTITADACDDTDVSSVTLQGPSGYLATAYGSGWGCTSVSAMVSLSPGANTFTGTACDLYGKCAWLSATIYYDAPPAARYAIATTPDGGTVGSVFTDETATVSLTVRNTGDIGGTTSVSASCAGAAAACWIASGNGVWLGPGAGTTISIGYTATSSVGVATLSARACFAESATTCDAGSVSVVVNPAPVASLAVTPTAAVLVPRQSVSMTAVPSDAAGHPLSGRMVLWSVADP